MFWCVNFFPENHFSISTPQPNHLAKDDNIEKESQTEPWTIEINGKETVNINESIT